MQIRKNKKEITALLWVFIVAGLFHPSCLLPADHDNSSVESRITDTVLAQVTAFHSFIKNDFLPAAMKKKSNQQELQSLFRKSRILFKKFEWAAAYFDGATTQRVNGPPVQEVDNADLLNPAYTFAIRPSGLQVIGALLFPKYNYANKKKLVKQLQLLVSNCNIYESYFTNHRLTAWRILDAAKQEVFRILTLGITDYDNPLIQNSMEESAAALESLKGVLARYSTNEGAGLTRQVAAAVQYLETHDDFDTFNRAEFIVQYGNKITAAITALQEKLHLFTIKYNRLLNQTAKTLFDSNAYNANAFAPHPQSVTTKAKVRLGKKLFSDAALSGTGTRSCASCHQPAHAFTDGLVKNTNIHGNTSLDRNTPTLLNAALQSNYFYDMRTLTLEAQARDVLENQSEMAGSLKEIVNYLDHNKIYKKLFSEAFPGKNDMSIDSSEVLHAIAAYVRSLVKLNSRFDQFMRGDSTALTKEEIKGFNLFMGKAKCATCHFMPLFNGITPPKYVRSEAEVIGVPQSPNDTIIDPDPGWYNIIGIPAYKYAFKTPTIRNIAKTAPYMHNGIFSTLKQVMDFYNNGGGVGTGVHIDNQTLSEDSLHLTDKETNEIIAFMKSLNSRY